MFWKYLSSLPKIFLFTHSCKSSLRRSTLTSSILFFLEFYLSHARSLLLPFKAELGLQRFFFRFLCLMTASHTPALVTRRGGRCRCRRRCRRRFRGSCASRARATFFPSRYARARLSLKRLCLNGLDILQSAEK